MKRVSIIEPVGGHGGCNYYDFSLCRGLLAAGMIPTLFTCDKTTVTGNEGFVVKRAYKAIYGDDPAWQRGIRYVLGSLQALFRSRLQGVRIAHFHFFHVGPLELFNVLLAKTLMMRVVVTAHDVEPFAENLTIPLAVKIAYRLADAVIAHNQISRDSLIEKISIPDKKISVIKHGNYLDYLHHGVTASEARAKLELSNDEFVVLFFGQIKEVKGLDVLIKAIAEVKRQTSRKVRLIIAGKTWRSDFSRYRELIDQVDLTNDCLLHIKYIPDDEVPMYYSAADVVALPYRWIYQSGVVLMAMSFGKPVIVSDIPGMTEVVSHGDTGLVFESENPFSLAEQILGAIKEPALLDVVARQGYQHMLDHYSWRQVGQLTAACYESLH